MEEKRASVTYISVPVSIAEKLKNSGGFIFDASIPIPAEIPADAENLPIGSLTVEIFLGGMIRVLSDNAANPNADYYRALIAALRPSLLEEFYKAALVKAQNGDFDMADEIALSLTSIFPESPLAHLAAAIVCEHRADKLNAKEEAAYSGAEAVYARTEVASSVAEEMYARSKAEYEKAFTAKPPLGAAFFNGACFFIKRREIERAAECFKRFLDITIDDEDDPVIARQREKAHNFLARAKKQSENGALFREAYKAVKKGDTEEGLRLVKRYIERDGRDWNGWFLLGWALRKQKRWADGESTLKQCIELGGDCADSHNERAICLLEAGRTKEARREAEAALRLDPGNAGILSNLGLIALREGKDEEAHGFFAAALDADPSEKAALKFFGKD